MSAFYRGVLDYFADILYPRFEYKVIGSYEKCIEYFNKVRSTGQEIDTNFLPSITLDPTYGFEPAELGGRFMWQSEQLAPGLGKRLFDKIEGTEEQDIAITPVFSRYQGTFDLIFWLESVYELIDFRLYLFQFSSGINRIMRPDFFESFIVLPDEVNNYSYDDGTIKIDWSKTDRAITLIDNLGNTRYTLPVNLTPWFKFTGISDATTKYGGDQVAEYKLSATVEFEIDIPTYMSITPYLNPAANVQIFLDSAYSRYGSNPIFDEDTGLYVRGGSIPETVLNNEESAEGYELDITSVAQRSYYKFTAADVITGLDADGNFTIPNPFDVDVTEKYIQIGSYDGLLRKGAAWVFGTGSTTIKIKVLPKLDEIVELYRYQDN